MMKKFLIISLLMIACVPFYAQEVSYDKVKHEFESFEYEKVIELSNQLLRTTTLPDTQLIDVYLMRAVSYYTIGNENSAQNNFREILKINKNYSPDPSQISPKLIALYGELKTEYLKSLEPSITKRDSIQRPQTIKVFDEDLLKGSMMRNVVLPGWGQIHSQASTKGFILSAASVANLTAIIYFIINTNKKENEYLIETNKNLIQQKYDSFNNSYKIRNALIVTYVIMWLYSQVDLLFFTDESAFLKEQSNTGSTMNFDALSNSLHLNLRVNF